MIFCKIWWKGDERWNYWQIACWILRNSNAKTPVLLQLLMDHISFFFCSLVVKWSLPDFAGTEAEMTPAHLTLYTLTLWLEGESISYQYIFAKSCQELVGSKSYFHICSKLSKTYWIKVIFVQFLDNLFGSKQSPVIWYHGAWHFPFSYSTVQHLGIWSLGGTLRLGISY